MRRILFSLYIVLLLVTNSFGQQLLQNVNQFYKLNPSEKIYAQLNNVLYLPEETVHYKIYLAKANNKPSTLNDYVYVDILDGSNKKLTSQTYLTTNGYAVGSYSIGKDSPAGMYKLRAYTHYQENLKEAVFEKTFFVQKTITPRFLMTLEFQKKGYGKGDIAKADFSLKDLDNKPLSNIEVSFDVFLAGSKLNTATFKTDVTGKAVIQFGLPIDLKTNDGIINVLVNYDNKQESITRSIPIQLDFVDLQFLPESGQYIQNQESKLFFIAKNEFGLPLDVSGVIVDEQGNEVSPFSSFHDGMGSCLLKASTEKRYFAKVTRPFASEKMIELPKALPQGFMLTSADENPTAIRIFSSKEVKAQLWFRTTEKINQNASLTLKEGWNEYVLEPSKFPVGIQTLSLVVDDNIVAEKLVFLNYQEGLKIDIKTDKESYLPREKVAVTFTTTNAKNEPVPSNLSVAVVDDKLLTYVNDKQHTMLTWFLFGFELKGTVYEPSYYFDESKPLEKRMLALHYLLNTHGWRKYKQADFLDNTYSQNPVKPEKRDIIEGYVIKQNQKPIQCKVYLFTDGGEVYETKSNNKGYFSFPYVSFKSFSYLVAEGNKKDISIKNSVSNSRDFFKLTQTLGYGDVKKEMPVLVEKSKSKEQPVAIETEEYQYSDSGNVVLKDSSKQLAECVVTAYGVSKSRKSIGYCVVQIRSSEINALSGKAAGLHISGASGNFGNASKVVIRGMSSIYGNKAGSQPLIVIDGVPLADNGNSDALNNISVNEIENVTVLKDAAASTFYGCKALNGAIVITTKKGNYNNVNGTVLGRFKKYKVEYIFKGNTKQVNEPVAFYAPVYETTKTDEKTDFRSCIYWNPVVQTNKEGKANLEFYNSDEVTTFKIIAEGTSAQGNLGHTEKSYSVGDLVETDVKLPLYATQGDEFSIPLRIKNNGDKAVTITTQLDVTQHIINIQDKQLVDLQPKESKVLYFKATAEITGKKIPVAVRMDIDGTPTTIKKEMDIYGKDFSAFIDIAGSESISKEFVVSNLVPYSLESKFKVFYNPFESLLDGIESMLCEPHGCFEQVSSSNYPNIMILQLLQQKGIVNKDLESRALGYLKNGYEKLKNYESRDGGFEWYGGNPGHEALSAYGLLQFHEMKNFIDVNQKMVQRTVNWLYSRKDGNGGFKQHQGKYGFSSIKYEVNNAYLVYALSEIGKKDFEQEYQKAFEEAKQSKDLYRLGLVAIASYNLTKYQNYQELLGLIKQEVKKQGIKNCKAAQTIVYSWNESQTVEIISLYALAVLKDKKMSDELDALLNYLKSAKKYYGYGSTQATVLAFKVFTEYNKLLASEKVTNGTITVALNNVNLDCTTKDTNGNINLDLTKQIIEAKNKITITKSAGDKTPYWLSVKYNTTLPQNSPLCKLDLETQLEQKKIKVAETSRLNITVTNKVNEPIFNPIVRIGIPGGATIETWQLKELVEKEKVDYYEIFHNELVLYYRSFNALEKKQIQIDFKAIIPGKYQGVASSTYLYYDNANKKWNKGVELEVVE